MSRPEHTARNEGLITRESQHRLARATVLVAGVGGVGGRCAEVLARMGVGALRLTDPDVFTVTNLNRQAASARSSLGLNKAEVIAAGCRDINPDLEVLVEPKGLTEENVEALVAGTDVVVDGTDYTKPELGLALARAARAHSVPVVMTVEIGFGGWVTTFPPDGEPRFEQLLGLRNGAQAHQLAQVPLWRWVGRLPSYVDTATLQRVQEGELEAPAVAPAVELTAALGSTAVLDLLEGRPTVTAPRIRHIDVRLGKTWEYRPTYLRFLASAVRARRAQA